MGKHRQVHCKICMRSMRSDNLKRHNKLIHWTKENTRAMDNENSKSPVCKVKFSSSSNFFLHTGLLEFFRNLLEQRE